MARNLQRKENDGKEQDPVLTLSLMQLAHLTQPFHHVLDVLHKHLLHGYWVCIVITQVGDPFVSTSITETEVHGHGMSNVKKSIRFRWESSDDLYE